MIIGDFSASATAASTAITAPEPHWLVEKMEGINGLHLMGIGLGLLMLGFIAALVWHYWKHTKHLAANEATNAYRARKMGEG